MSPDSFLNKLKKELSKSHEKELVASMVTVIKKNLDSCSDISELVDLLRNTDVLYEWVVTEVDDRLTETFEKYSRKAVSELINSILPTSLEVTLSAIEFAFA